LFLPFFHWVITVIFLKRSSQTIGVSFSYHDIQDSGGMFVVLLFYLFLPCLHLYCSHVYLLELGIQSKIMKENEAGGNFLFVKSIQHLGGLLICFFAYVTYWHNVSSFGLFP